MMYIPDGFTWVVVVDGSEETESGSCCCFRGSAVARQPTEYFPHIGDRTHRRRRTRSPVNTVVANSHFNQSTVVI